MAKAKDKTKDKKAAGKGKKASGAKLPKAVRKSGLMDLVNSDLGREILADALIAAAGAAAAALTKTRTVKKVGSAAVGASSQAADVTKDAMQTAAGAVAGVVTEAARQFLPASLTGEQEDEGGDRDKPAGKRVQYASRSSDTSKAKTSSKTSDDKAGRH
jgi:hypothetical protein